MVKVFGRGLIGAVVAGATLASATLASAVWAGDVPTEVNTLQGAKVTLHVYPFLKPDELKTLRLVATNSQALALFVPGDKSHYSAMALAPDDGFMKDGAPVNTAIALSDFTDPASASAAAKKACDDKRGKKGKACVIVLEVGPAS